MMNIKNINIDELGDDHIATSANTPLRKDAFELSDDDKIKEIEKNNGFLAQLQKGTIQRKIEESAVKEQQQFDKGEIILVGTNKFLNTNDTMKDDLQLYPFVKQNSRKTVIKPIIEKRLSEKLEQKRLQSE